MDYRESHLNGGETYDKNLASSPFDDYMAEVEREYLTVLIKKLFPNGISRYLDFACGTARVTKTVSDFAQQSIGVDVSPTMLEQARNKCPNVRFIQADLTSEHVDIGSFNLITAFRFFGNAQQELRQAVLERMSTLIRPDGFLIINNHRNPNAIAAVLHRATGGRTDDQDLSHGKMKRLLANAGFLLVSVCPIGVWLFRSSMLARVGKLDDRLLRREKLFGHPRLAGIAPNSIIVAQRDPRRLQ